MAVIIGLIALLVISYALLEYRIWSGHEEEWVWTKERPRRLPDKPQDYEF